MSDDAAATASAIAVPRSVRRMGGGGTVATSASVGAGVGSHRSAGAAATGATGAPPASLLPQRGKSTGAGADTKFLSGAWSYDLHDNPAYTVAFGLDADVPPELKRRLCGPVALRAAEAIAVAAYEASAAALVASARLQQ
jgi:hypothetical protein